MPVMVVSDKLEAIRKELGLTREVFYELTMRQLSTLRCGVVVGAKWTRGELASILEDRDGERALEILEYLSERGPRVIDWSDERVPCERCQRLDGHSERCLARQDEEARAEEHTAEVDSR
jgi:hypothetical protein